MSSHLLAKYDLYSAIVIVRQEASSPLTFAIRTHYDRACASGSLIDGTTAELAISTKTTRSYESFHTYGARLDIVRGVGGTIATIDVTVSLAFADRRGDVVHAPTRTYAGLIIAPASTLSLAL